MSLIIIQRGQVLGREAPQPNSAVATFHDPCNKYWQQLRITNCRGGCSRRPRQIMGICAALKVYSAFRDDCNIILKAMPTCDLTRADRRSRTVYS